MQTVSADGAPSAETVDPGLEQPARPNTARALFSALGEWPSVFVVVAVTVFVFCQLRPGLLFSANLDVGGDTAAHVVAVHYFIHHLLAHGKLSGWDPQWFDGFPLYVFYFPLPAVLVAVLQTVLRYSAAFNLVTVAGTLLTPGAAYGFGRLSGFRRPVPALMSVTSLVFLFNVSYTIDGGNLASTLAGEFSFSLAIPLGLTFLGFYVRSLRTGRGRSVAALFFAATTLSHVVPALFFGFAAVLISLGAKDRRRSCAIGASILAVGTLLSAFWLVRFGAYLGYSSSMNYERVGDVFSHLFPRDLELSMQLLAVVGAVFAVRARQRIALALAGLALCSVAAFALLPDGLVYNERWEPFWFLTTSLLAAYGVGEALRALLGLLGRSYLHASLTPVICGAATVILIAANLGVLPGYHTPSGWRSFLPDWVQWNYSGYQSKPGWPQFQRIVAMLQRSAATYGCGRLDYEYTANATNPFGSTLVEMSFPLWTNGCIDTTEGVYYESSTTNDFHFLDQSELSIASSDPVSGLPYEPLNVADGVRHLQLMGVKYFLANSPTVEAEAAKVPALQKIASTPASPDVIETEPTGATPTNPRWVLYRVRDSHLVSPLSHLPVVESGQSKTDWQNTAIDWYQHPRYWSVPIARSGPPNWPRAIPGSLALASASTCLAPTKVSHVLSDDESLSFDVSRTGVPVAVKVPYFPNWQAQGATGPYESSPNTMIVVPTAHHVVLSYGTTTIDWLGRGGSIVGLAGLVAMRVLPMPSPRGLPGSEPEPEPEGEPVNADELERREEALEATDNQSART